jgi:hypothetical protein
MRSHEIVQFSGRQRFQQCCEPDELRFDHPLLHANVLREAAAVWNNNDGSRPHQDDSTPAPAGATGDRLAQAGPFVERLAAATNTSEIVTLVDRAARVLGADAAIVLNLDLDGARIAACQVMLAGDQTCFPGLSTGTMLDDDPWISYGTKHSESMVASGLHVAEAAVPPLKDLAERQCLESVMLVPAHSGINNRRTTLLCLGSICPGFFEGEGFAQARLGARLLAAELHAWHFASRRLQLLASTRLTPADLALLQLERQGNTSERIAAAMNVSKDSINSRFQRMLYSCCAADIMALGRTGSGPCCGAAWPAPPAHSGIAKGARSTCQPGTPRSAVWKTWVATRVRHTQPASPCSSRQPLAAVRQARVWTCEPLMR